MPKGRGNSNYRRGRAAEYELMGLLKKEGYSVLRTAGSHGFADIVAYTDNQTPVRLIQVKSTKSKATRDALFMGWAPKTTPKALTFTTELYVKHEGKWWT